MLDSSSEIAGYKAYTAAGGLKTPQAANTSTAAASAATSKAETLSALVVSDYAYSGSSYDVTTYTAKITGWAAALTGWSALGACHAALLEKYADLSLLTQMSLGWDVYCRANSLPSTELTISVAEGDNATPSALVAAIGDLATSDVVAAMTPINTKLADAAAAEAAAAAAAASGGAGTTTPTPVSITDDELLALSTACAAFDALMTTATLTYTALNTLSNNASTSAINALAAYNSAVSVSLVNSLKDSNPVASAVSSMVPATVITALES